MTTFASVCSGIGAPEVAWTPLGWRPMWFAEIEAHPSTVLAHHWPRVPNMGDMTKIPALVRLGLLPAPDVLVGGTPCQAFSLAGLRGGLTDARGQLTLTYVDLLNAIDERRAEGDECVAVWENVPGVLSDSTNAFGCFLAALAGEDVPLECAGGKWPNAGLVVGPQRAIAWRILDAQYFGVAQRRRRVFVVASARNGFDPAAILFELDGLRRDSPPRRETEEEIAGALTSSLGRRGGQPDCGSTPGHLICVSNPEGSSGLPFLTCSNIGKTVNNQTPLLAFSSKDYGADCTTDLSPTLRAGGHSGSPRAVAYREVQGFQSSQSGVRVVEAHATLDANNGSRRHNGVFYELAQRWCVRRLTPRECERLQGFPDDHTLVPLPDRRQPSPRGDRRAEPRMMADGPRYKALGNSMCVHVMRWLGLRLMFSGCLTR